MDKQTDKIKPLEPEDELFLKDFRSKRRENRILRSKFGHMVRSGSFLRPKSTISILTFVLFAFSIVMFLALTYYAVLSAYPS